MIRWLFVAGLVACSSAPHRERAPKPAAPPAVHTLTIIGTNDLHGALVRLPLIAGYVANVRAARAADGGGVLLVDGGDLFQGTLESNVGEGADVIKAYNAMGYTASAIGNHEFDFGPVGPAVTAQHGEDPRGALKARIAEAKFPFLETDIADAATGAVIAWPNVKRDVIVEVAGIKVGLIGASTQSTPTTTMPANFVGLEMTPAAQGITDAARELRAKGAQVVVVIAHIGSACRDIKRHDDTSSCDTGDELFRVVEALPRGLVDVFVGGHTHAMVAHRVNGVAAIESLSSGRAFGRVDVQVTGGKISGTTISEPVLVCPLDKQNNPVAVADCHPDPYEGRPVVPDAGVQKIVDAALQRAGERRAEKLGVTLTSTLMKAYGSESEEGDLFADLMLAARPDADVALTNGGGLRADVPAGDLTYGRLFEAMPFDNRFALVKVKGKHIRRLLVTNLERAGGILSWAGMTAKARCKEGKLATEITIKGKPLVDDASYTIVTSDFLASGGDGLFAHLDLPAGSMVPTDTIMRDAMAEMLRKRAGTLDPKQIPKRLDYEGRRPVSCGGKHEDEDAAPQ
jgi:2',3'-cyclic-nucleotide 2'-phosphodiesterase (5'-nucleotidase family)